KLLMQGVQLREVQVAAVVDLQNDAGLPQDQLEGALNMGHQDALVADGGVFHEIVTAAQGERVFELLGQGAAGVACEAVGDVDQTAGAAFVPQVGLAKVFLPERRG